MMISTAVNRSYSINTPRYSLDVLDANSAWIIDLRMYISLLGTRALPETFDILEHHLPSVLKAECFNQSGLPFETEVRATEVGHLFEHILLEYLCLMTPVPDGGSIAYEGKTEWDWISNTPGSFLITIGKISSRQDGFPGALRRTITLFDLIIGSRTMPVSDMAPISRYAALPAPN
ncbi:hypothetical protein A2Z33_00590 [Candidatus Gottesmanbacteria bacterium RBG_16_52_11]|uniref:Cyanophycin synthase-like N-terminal domain-containing protein n=1 Tax=Candidatus Gottesmanbacteria bacterium RBG_16_52_11 TaxID=1798374 RepID=A0A1F5YMV7_9BACT|nr:MAG: hypothetical protein A2Z33_00590 [Candidatus Gottesmanbacteria bacterium RBG_16_52_11]